MSKKKKDFFRSGKDGRYKYYQNFIDEKYNEYLKSIEKERVKGRLMKTFSKKEFKDIMDANLTMKKLGQLNKRSPLAQTIKDSQEFTSKRAQKWAEKFWNDKNNWSYIDEKTKEKKYIHKRKMTGSNMGYYIQKNVEADKWYRRNGRVYDADTDQLIY